MAPPSVTATTIESSSVSCLSDMVLLSVLAASPQRYACNYVTREASSNGYKFSQDKSAVDARKVL